ncbi:MAG: class II fructose-bisphosphate aldolase [Candidatus Faecousia sp.]|nr:class II fructose-bisphosphate aldolase [Clostridiales bacterium]MDY6180000.1 class II fructose-bisphosphate aldolase [Candidatus Faecousia sp.]
MYEKVSNILHMARQSNTSVIAFICMDYVMARTVVYAAEAANTPAVVMLFPEHVTVQKTTGLKGYAEMVRELADGVKVPIGLHLDHDYSLEAITKAMDAGFGSVMMDGSMHPLEENIRLTRQVVEAAHARGVTVEGEIGHVGSAAQADNRNEDLFTQPGAAERFCRESGVDALAVSIGNAHGEYKQTPKLDLRRLEEIHSATPVPLVLHGGSGIPDDQLLAAFSRGIRKFNLGTDYLRRYFQATADFAREFDTVSDPVKIIGMPEYVQAKLQPYVENRLRTLCRF